MEPFLKNRQNALKEIPEEDIEKWVKNMLGYLGGEIWLEKSKNREHPIVKLWNRPDFMATNEIVNFARAVSIMDEIDKKWLEKTMKLVSGKDLNNAKGAIFEILALSLLAYKNGAYKVVPTSVGSKGIDGSLIYNDGTIVNLSLKYYGKSVHEKAFMKYMEEIYKDFVSIIDKKKILSADLVLYLNKYVDGKNEMNSIKTLVYDTMKDYDGIHKFQKNTEQAIVSVKPIVLGDGDRLSNKKKSFKFVAFSPCHKNEYKNLSDKIEEAKSNLLNSKPEIKENEYNGVVIHIDEDADIEALKNEAQEYLNNNPKSGISFIVLYQVAIVYNIKEDNYAINHTIMPAIAIDRLESFAKRKNLINFDWFLGSVSTSPCRRMVYHDDKAQYYVDRGYIFQKGRLYKTHSVGPNGAVNGICRLMAPGVKESPVFPMGNNKFVVLEMKTFEDDHLEIT